MAFAGAKCPASFSAISFRFGRERGPYLSPALRCLCMASTLSLSD